MPTRREKPAPGKRLPPTPKTPRIAVLFTTFANRADAERVCGALVENRAIVCATILPGAVSIYPWKGRIERAEEVFVIIKTAMRARRAAARALLELHPYETPELIIQSGFAWNDAYLAWLDAWTRPATS